jgi:hypothetical protein
MNWDNHYGVAISEEKRNQWAEKVLENMKNHPDQEFYYIWSGESLVIACRVGDGIEVFDTKVVRSMGENQ